MNWKVLRFLGIPFGAELALVNSSLGMQFSFLYVCIYVYTFLISQSPFFSLYPLSEVFIFLRDFSGALLSLFGAGLSLPWKFRELSLPFFLGSFSKRLIFQIRPFLPSSGVSSGEFLDGPPFSVGR